MLLGSSMLESSAIGSVDLDSHFRYLSGLLLAIGIGYASTVLHIETQEYRFRLLTACVVLGGVGRLISLLLVGAPSQSMLGALIMELLVAPGLADDRPDVALYDGVMNCLLESFLAKPTRAGAEPCRIRDTECC